MSIGDGDRCTVNNIQIAGVLGEEVSTSIDPHDDGDAAMFEYGFEQELVAGDISSQAGHHGFDVGADGWKVWLSNACEDRGLHMNAGLGRIHDEDGLGSWAPGKASQALFGSSQVFIEIDPRSGTGAARGDAGDRFKVFHLRTRLRNGPGKGNRGLAATAHHVHIGFGEARFEIDRRDAHSADFGGRQIDGQESKFAQDRSMEDMICGRRRIKNQIQFRRLNLNGLETSGGHGDSELTGFGHAWGREVATREESAFQPGRTQDLDKQVRANISSAQDSDSKFVRHESELQSPLAFSRDVPGVPGWVEE